ncbi:MAG: hypothetical protein Kow00124_12290 [Anaerolineae bacterium]
MRVCGTESGEMKNRQLIILWLVVMVAYAAVFYATDLRMLLRFSGQERQALFDEISGLICDHVLLGDAAEAIAAFEANHRLLRTDTRYLYTEALRRGWPLEPCFAQAISRLTCQGYYPGVGGYRGGLWAARLTDRQVRLIIERARSQGVPLDPCVEDGAQGAGPQSGA